MVVENSTVSKESVIHSAEKVAYTGILIASLALILGFYHALGGAVAFALAIGLVMGAVFTAVLGAGWHK